MQKTPPIESTPTGYRLGDLEILFGVSGRGGVLRANSLVLHGPRPIVVDPAGGESRHRELAGQNPIIFYTHYHGDHRMSEHLYKDGTTVWASALDADAIESMDECAARIGGKDSPMTKMMATSMKSFMKLRDWTVERRMNGGETLEVGGCRAELIHYPGHTPGHMGMFFPEQSLLFITDMDLTAFGPWYGNAVSDKNAFRDSIRRAREFECKWYYTSHGEVVYGREEFLDKLEAFEAHFDRRDNLLLDALATGEKAMPELCRLEVVYRLKTLQKMEHMVHMERIHVDFHLRDLIARGLVKADDAFEHFALA